MKTLKSLASILGVCALSLIALTAHAETVSVTFQQPDGGVSSGLYNGQVLLNVSGVGKSLGNSLNDAFYVFTDGGGSPIAPFHDGSYYQLTFGTSPLVAFSPAQDASNFLAAPLPAYNPNHDYTFVLNTGLVAPGALHFGVSDGIFADNDGGYRVTITQLGSVPEPGSVALLIGSSVAGFSLLRRRRR